MATTTTVAKSPAALKAALLTPADVRGSKVAAPTPGDDQDDDLSACFPGNPLGVKTDPNEVASPSLELTQSRIERTYDSAARQGTPEQAAMFVATVLSPAGSPCLLNSFKTAITDGGRADPNPVTIDASGLTATSTDVAVADGGAVLTTKGVLKVAGKRIPLTGETLFFRKGGVLVLVDVGAIGGSTAPGEAVELARKVAGRLP